MENIRRRKMVCMLRRRKKGRKLFVVGKYLLTVPGKLSKSNDMGESVWQSEWHITACEILQCFQMVWELQFMIFMGRWFILRRSTGQCLKFILCHERMQMCNVLKSFVCPKWQTSAGEFVKWNLICRQIREGKTFNQMRKVQFQTSFNACYNSSL